jgi:hypothetical protein
LSDWVNACGEPGPDDEADRDAPHPSTSDLSDPLDIPFKDVVEPFDPGDRDVSAIFDPATGDAAAADAGTVDAEAQRALDARLAQIKHDAHTHPAGHAHPATGARANGAGANGAGANGAGGAAWRLRPGKTEIFVHLTDHTLATGTGVLRVEDLGPLLAGQLSELVGHGPYVVKPVIDLNDAVSVDAYEIPNRIRERVKLMYPVELFLRHP